MQPSQSASRPQPPEDGALRDKVDEVLSRDEYDLTGGDRVSNEFLEFVETVIRWVRAPFRWLLELTEDLPEPVRWIIIIGLSALVLLLIWHIVFTAARAVRRSALEEAASSQGFSAVDESVPAVELERLADAAEERGEFIEAVRLLLRASLVRLEAIEAKPFRRGTTGREHLRRYRGTLVLAPLEVLVRTVERKWFGEEVCVIEDLDRCRESHRSIAELTERTSRDEAA